MTKQFPSWTTYLGILGLLVCVAALLASGCSDRSQRPRSAAGVAQRKSSDADFLVETVADSLNNLPREIVLDLTPPKPILDDAKSADGQPVMATCTQTPGVEGGAYNFIAVPKGNANFREVGVRPGDVVRFFAKFDAEGVEHGYGQVGFFELVVRRLDTYNPESALIVEGGLSAPVPIPQRIEVWRFSDKRMDEIRQRMTRYLERPKTLIGWEPSPDESALAQLVERANQWLRNLSDEAISWSAEPLIAELPDKLKESKPLTSVLSENQLTEGTFRDTEARQLQQAIWLRDISRWAKGEAISPVEVATELFDWTVRNIQLDSSDSPPGYVHQPWQILAYGHGTARQRAWIFAELCRQQQLDVVMLASGEKWWLPALLDDGKLYLFDTRLGLPIPGSEPGSVATLTELQNDEELLSQLRVEGEDTYPITAEDLKNITTQLVASPLQLSKRAQLLEEELEGDDYVVLSASTDRLKSTLKDLSAINSVELWPYPFQSILDEINMDRRSRLRALQQFIVFAQRPRLWKARVLHFQGTKAIPIEDRNDPLAQPDLGHQRSIALYQDPRVRPAERQLEQLEASKRAIYDIAKAGASYWLGLLSYDLGRYSVAEDWLARRTLEARPDGPWTNGARYNLARTHEARGDLPAAIKLLESDESPQRLGNLLRARQLQQRLDSDEETKSNE